MKKIAVLLVVSLLFSQTAFATDTERKAQGEGVRITIIDTGISTLAIDKERVAEGKNYIQPTEGTEDKIGHGTAIASLLLGRESRGLVGASPKATLVPLVYCTLTEEGHIIKGDSTMLAQCIREAVDMFGCRVINLSAGVLEDTQELRKAISYAEERGAVIVSAVGNDNRKYPARIYYPAAYDTVLGVGALNEKGQVASYSQRNSSVALCAPGDNLWVARASGKMTHVSGASYACAYVSAAAANLLSVYPSLTPKELRQILCSTALDIGAKGYDTNSGFGVLNAAAVLQYPIGGQRFSDVPRGAWYFDGYKP